MTMPRIENMPEGCITANYKESVANLIRLQIGAEFLLKFLDNIPNCATPTGAAALAAAAAVPEHERQAAAKWLNPDTGEPIRPTFIDKDGKETPYNSISAVVQAHGIASGKSKMSGTVCDLEGKKCRATSSVEILQFAGFVVRDNGNSPVKGVSKKLTVYHPDAPQLKLLSHK
jgi:ribosomal protein L12E/L44/L45/RPP1/RPP2